MFKEEIETVQKYYEIIAAYLITHGIQILVGIIILLVGYKLAGWVNRLVLNLCQKRHLDITLSRFLASAAKFAVLGLFILFAIDKFGITISPIIAAVSAMIFGASFAIQAPLSNYAAGLSIIFSRPFTVGDTVSIKGHTGIVQEVKLPCTILLSGHGERVTIPNKDIVGEVIVNSFENAVTTTSVGISYGDDPEKAISVIERALAGQPGVVKSPEPIVGIEKFCDFSIDVGIRYWSPTKDRFQTSHDVHMAVYRALKSAGITIPYPQHEVRVLSGVALQN